MSSEQQRALRIALTFTVSFIWAELMRRDLQLTFLAQLVAGSLACGPALPARVLIALPIIAWLLVAAVGMGIAMKSLNVLAILIGEGFSVFYEDADDCIWTRIAGVVIGLLYVALIVGITRRRASHGPEAPLRGAQAA